MEAALAAKPWQAAREDVRVKLLPEGEELYAYVQSARRVGKERAMRRRRLKKLWRRLADLARKPPPYEMLLQKIGAARQLAGRDARLVSIELPAPPHDPARASVSFSFQLDRRRLRQARRREGRYLLRSNLPAEDPATLWEFYLQLVEVEASFRTIKGELGLRPIFHQMLPRVEAHIFVAFMAYALHVTLKALLRAHAPGLTPKQAIDKLSAIQMLDVHFPTTDGRELIFTRYTKPEPDQQLLLDTLGWKLPNQPPPRITAKGKTEM
jgi:hypothetical protein